MIDQFLDWFGHEDGAAATQECVFFSELSLVGGPCFLDKQLHFPIFQ
jgi:hypothetical protein